MKKLLIPLLAGLVIGLGLSTGAVVLLGGEKSLTDSLAEHVGEASADSAGVEGEHATEQEQLAEAPAESLAHQAAGEAPGGSADPHAPAATPLVQTAGLTSTTLGATSVGSTEAAMETARLARLFGSMQPREAARVMEHMNDYEVQVILGQLGNREAAAILGNLNPERAAIISRSVISGERSTP